MAITQNSNPVEAEAISTSYLEWGAVWAGAIVAIAISTVLLQFGASVGLAMGEPIRLDNTVSYNFIVAALWILLVSVSSFTASGYLAGRMRRTMKDADANEVEFLDGVHGLTAWALASVIMASIVSFGALVAATGAVVADASTYTPELNNWAENQRLIIAFASASGAALGAAAAWFASVTGGKHRNEATSYGVVVPKMFRKK